MRTYLLTIMLAIAASVAQAQHPIEFKVKVLTVDSNEGCSVADFDNDGKLDISAGRNWFRNGDWLPRPVRMIEDRDGYVRSNGEWAYDVNGDGNTDVISMDFVQEAVNWYENPGPELLSIGAMWPQHLLANTGLLTNETSYLVDLNGDGRPEWISDQWNKTNPLVAWSFVTEKAQTPNATGRKTAANEDLVPKLNQHLIGTSTGHGIGFGDINGDGHLDILVGTGWYEGPDSNPLDGRWRFHPAWQIQGACPMIVHDVDGDGRNDVLVSKAHDYGISLWLNQGVADDGEIKFNESLIDDSYSQAHCLHLADLDGDGTAELVTGKRVRAHNGRDPGGKEPPIVKYYVWDPKEKKYEGHVISQGEVGIGLQIRTADLDDDGDLDLVFAGKEGTQILFSQLK
ncbi:MAG: VCBS repeat-containing protein [Planctomycetales bacterium]|nr:VCBS repeat-containing protein [Planctomycetales bacterium]